MTRGRPAEVARKLGLRPGLSVSLIQVPATLEAVLRRGARTGIRWVKKSGPGSVDVVIYVPRRHAELERIWPRLQRMIKADGCIWAIVPRKPIAEARGLDFRWQDVQTAALRTDLVDNKDASVSDEEYATRFVIRRSARPG